MEGFKTMNEANKRPKLEDGQMNRSDILWYTSAENAIRNALIEVEKVGAHPLLTNSVTSLCDAQRFLQDFLEQTQAA